MLSGVFWWGLSIILVFLGIISFLAYILKPLVDVYLRGTNKFWQIFGCVLVPIIAYFIGGAFSSPMCFNLLYGGWFCRVVVNLMLIIFLYGLFWFFIIRNPKQN